MCWVMPPASPATTLALRMASSSEVLPWSTWPMMVTTGGRGDKVLLAVGDVEQPFLDVGLSHAPDGMAEFGRDQLGRVGVDHVAGLHDLALLHEVLDHVDRALRHAAGEVLDGDGLRQGHLAHDLLARLLMHGALELLLAAAHGRQRARARVAVLRGKRGGESQLAAALVVLAPLGAGGRPRGSRCGERASRRGRATAPRLPRPRRPSPAREPGHGGAPLPRRGGATRPRPAAGLPPRPGGARIPRVRAGGARRLRRGGERRRRRACAPRPRVPWSPRGRGGALPSLRWRARSAPCRSAPPRAAGAAPPSPEPARPAAASA